MLFAFDKRSTCHAAGGAALRPGAVRGYGGLEQQVVGQWESSACNAI